MNYIEYYLCFAARKLGIKDPIFHKRYSVQYPKFGVLGMFDHTPLITFFGEPNLNTIFHEAVHFKQYEDGLDFESKTMEYFGACQDVYRNQNKSQSEIEWLAWGMLSPINTLRN